MEPIQVVPDHMQVGPFHDRQKALGATFYEDMGWLWTAGFGNPIEEYWAVRRGVGLWDVSALVKFRFAGPDTLAALDRLTTRATSGLAPGTVRYGAVLDERGLMLDEGTTFVIAPDEAYLFGNDERDPFVEHLERHTAGLDVRIKNVTARIPNIAVQGPGSYELLARLADVEIAELKWFRLFPEPVTLAGVRGLLSRTGFTGELGYEFFLLDPDGAEALWDAILDAGATPFGLDAVELLRVEAGLLIQHEDYIPGETDPYELSLDAYIDLEGHHFVGREEAARRAAAPPRRFTTLVVDGDDVPEAGTQVVVEGRSVGDVRSSVRTPRFGTIALAVLDAAHAFDGGAVEVGGHAATVRPVPIDDPRKLRPRSDPHHPTTVS